MKMNYSTEKVYENVEIEDGIYKLTIKGNFNGKPGQFYMLRSWNREPLLSRPISINHIDKEKIVFLYQVVGEGTETLSRLKKFEDVEIMGPLGNGFDIDNIKGKVAIVSGGIGTAPMQYVAETLKECSIDLYAGFRDKSYIIDEFKQAVENIKISTETGREGYKGYITDIFKPELYDVVLCCGPEVMMNKVAKLCKDKSIKVYISMEKHMACGVGACLVCTCKTKHGNKRTCKDGPVFLGEEIL
ncbi:dihydroorotate dehydrogenase electron transfer subunit [Clostridium muellerianum]|uniref:dihydroorotate dehydrogenase electron transfer subunit n=1 Tax=Clostridium muellerianum TaxID=2716538 RepID=UPI00315A5B2B